jgi:hypothetical protein
VGAPGVVAGGTIPVCDLSDWLDADRVIFACESPITDSICAART